MYPCANTDTQVRTRVISCIVWSVYAWVYVRVDLCTCTCVMTQYDVSELVCDCLLSVDAYVHLCQWDGVRKQYSQEVFSSV